MSIFKKKWFNSDVKFFAFFIINIQSPIFKKGIFVREHFSTLIINLTKPVEEIFNGFKPNTRNEIRRAQKDGIKAFIEKDHDSFMSFFNISNMQTGLKKITSLSDYRDVIIFNAIFENEIISSLCFADFKNIGRARLLYSVNAIKGQNVNASFIGRANRMLHFEAINYFKSNGYNIYDFGGFSGKETGKTFNIDLYKKSFTNELEYSYNYYPIIYYFALKTYLKWRSIY